RLTIRRLSRRDHRRRRLHVLVHEVARLLDRIDAIGEDDAVRAHPVELWLVDTRRDSALVAQLLRLVQEKAPHPDYARVGHAQVLVVALVDYAHALGHGAVLAPPGDAAKAEAALVRPLGIAVDQVVVADVTCELEAPQPVARVVARVVV